jgi:hypothetical protein
MSNFELCAFAQKREANGTRQTGQLLNAGWQQLEAGYSRDVTQNGANSRGRSAELERMLGMVMDDENMRGSAITFLLTVPSEAGDVLSCSLWEGQQP